MKTETLTALTVVLLALCQTAWAQTTLPPQKIQGFDLPGAVAGLNRRSVVDYEKDQPGLGTAIHYVYPGIKGSVFIYNRGYARIESGVDSPLATREFKAAKSDIEKAYPEAQILVAEERLTVNGVPLLHAAYKYADERAGLRDPVFSHLYVTVVRNQFLKLRVTHSIAAHPEIDYEPTTGMRLATRFVEQMIQSLTK